MTSTLNPYVNFAGSARQALEFYAGVFGGTPTVMTFGQTGMAGPDADKVMHGLLQTTSGFTLMCSDALSSMDHIPGNTMSISLSGTEEAELRGYWAALSSAGTVSAPLEKQIWGDVFGMCTDQFGVTWMVNINQS